MITQGRLIELLHGLPETRLELLDVTWKLIGEDGLLDPHKISFHSIEIEKAVAQAEAYSRGTKETLQCLTRILQ